MHHVQLKHIRIGFSRPRNRIFPLFSWLVRLYMGKPYSHVYLEFMSDKSPITFIYEAVGTGVRFVGKRYWERYAQEVLHFDVYCSDKENYYELLEYCAQGEGQPYGFLQNIGVAIADLFNLKSNPFKAGKNCSEVVAKFLKKEEFILPNKELNLITPADIEEVLRGSKTN